VPNSDYPADVLLVDDNELFRFIAERRLRSSKLVLKSCESAEQALEFLSHNRVALIILDLRLPNMAGDALLRELTEKDLVKGAKVCICTSALPHIDVCKRIEALGAQILTKDAILDKNGIDSLFPGQIDAA